MFCIKIKKKNKNRMTTYKIFYDQKDLIKIQKKKNNSKTNLNNLIHYLGRIKNDFYYAIRYKLYNWSFWANEYDFKNQTYYETRYKELLLIVSFNINNNQKLTKFNAIIKLQINGLKNKKKKF